MDNDIILKTANLSKKFGKLKAVDNLDIAVRSGNIYGFLGRNGAGKTTTIRMLMGIINPDAGNISILGEKSKRITKKQKQMIGYVSQENYFYQWMTCKSIGDFVSGFYPTWDNDEYKRLLEVMDLPVDRKISDLSGGMKLKAALALALAYRPKLLILDEPTSGLDPAARKEFLNLVAHQAEKYGRTTFFSSHIIGEVEQISSHICIIDKGRKKYEGTIDELQKRVKKVIIKDYKGEENNSSDLFNFFINNIKKTYQNKINKDEINIISGFSEQNHGELLIQSDVTDWKKYVSTKIKIIDMSLEDIFISLTEKEAVL